MYKNGSSVSTFDIQYKQRKNYLDSIEKATQMEMDKKNIYDTYILEGLLHTNSNINRSYVKINNSESVINNKGSLSDIKTILLTTNEKLDLILKKLTERNSYKHKEQVKQRKCKPCKIRPTTASELAIPTSQNGLMDLPNLMNSRSNSVTTQSIPKVTTKDSGTTSNLHYVAPYNTSYYMYGTNTNFFRRLGSKYSDADMASSVWNPFIFMAANVHTKQIKLGKGGVNISCNKNISDPTSLGFDDEMEQMSCVQD